MVRNFVLLKSDMFLHKQRDEDIDKWMVGGDCAAWIFMRLLATTTVKHWHEPVMEDWGWTFEISVDEIRVIVNVWGFSIENCWLIGLVAKRTIFRRSAASALTQAHARVADAIDTILCNDSRILKHQWFAENPLELDVRQF